jgi:hypothetical protein
MTGMPHPIKSAHIATPMTEVVTSERSLARERQAFTNSLLEAGAISQEFVDSGALEQFSLNEQLGRDALPHILVGDEYGGAHHLPSILDSGADTQAVATILGSKKMRHYRSSQRVRENGVYELRKVVINSKDGESVTKVAGSAFFPNEWTTQEVLEAIIAVSQKDGVHNPDNHAYGHEGEINGVRMVVNTDDFTRKIVAARPLRPEKNQ